LVITVVLLSFASDFLERDTNDGSLHLEVSPPLLLLSLISLDLLVQTTPCNCPLELLGFDLSDELKSRYLSQGEDFALLRDED
jgi:hypothetical protein